VEARNQADAAVYTAEKSLKEANDRIPPNVKSAVEQALAAVKDAMKSDDIERIKQTTSRLSQTAMRIGEEAPSRSAADSGGDSGASQAESNVVDAEFEEVDKRNRKAG
jgi:molecular chaperone DnaK